MTCLIAERKKKGKEKFSRLLAVPLCLSACLCVEEVKKNITYKQAAYYIHIHAPNFNGFLQLKY